MALDGIATPVVDDRTPVVDDRLREIGLGDFEGRTDAELWAGWPHVMARKGPLPWHFHAPGGETWEAFNARIAGWLADQRARR
ncbi:histidine phosphatase family protein [Maritimibacter sp. HL-12]|uniref:histidine phosphatase family protein n=1 Tax=Maritimibacter sp. HL-12 TaxID=1162418 RepID=UPI0020CAC57A|nr:histidine phosphatase family protein [Maritimibacter sp. HL-12]